MDAVTAWWDLGREEVNRASEKLRQSNTGLGWEEHSEGSWADQAPEEF